MPKAQLRLAGSSRPPVPVRGSAEPAPAESAGATSRRAWGPWNWSLRVMNASGVSTPLEMFSAPRSWSGWPLRKGEKGSQSNSVPAS